MRKSLLKFTKGGVHPREEKELTAHLPIEQMPVPDEVEILLSQHFGSPCEALVEKKAQVAEGDLIGKVKKGLGANIHSSVTGKVKNISTSPHPITVNSASIVIETDHDAESRDYKPHDWKRLKKNNLIKKITDAGIVGIGGAGFPTHVKLSPPPGVKLDTLILNGAECEPYLTTDHRVMLEYPEEIIESSKILMTLLGIKQCHIGIEANKSDAIELLQRLAREKSDGFRITINPLRVKYPQGSEKQLIQGITGRKVPGFGLPFDVGVIVQNIGTAKAIYDAVVLGKPLYEKVITISGKGIKRPANLHVKIGTKLADIVSHLGGTRPGLEKVVVGGPMMGFAVSTLDIPITKTTSGILFLTDEETDKKSHGQCIRCGWCLDACPMGLSPNEIGIYVEAGRAEDTEPFGVFECFECGCCAFVCPAKRPLVQFIRLAKMKAKKE